jgi:ABC-type transport system involved in multi-copper enzyme maturation permease subunit
MEAPAARKPVPINRWLPYWAVFQADLGQTLRSWVYRFWVLASALATAGFLLSRAAPARQLGVLHNASDFLNDLLHWFVLGSITLIIILTAGSISGERGSLADSILSRGISRYQYFLGKWHARLVAVLGAFLLLGVVALGGGMLLLHEDVSWSGGLMALATVAAMLAAVISAGVAVSAMTGSTVFGMSLLWLTLHGLGFALSLLPPQYPSPERALRYLPHILRGYYDPEMLVQVMLGCGALSLAAALCGAICFSRRDV